MRKLHLLLLTAVLASAPAVARADVGDDLKEGDRYYEEGNYKKAGAAYDRAIRSAPGQVPPEAYAKRATIFVIEKDLEGGLTFVRERAKREHPNAPEVLEQEAVILWGLGKKGDAITAAEKAAGSKESAFAAQLLIGDYYAARDSQKTVTAYEAYFKHRPEEREKSDVLPRIRFGYAYIDLASRDVLDGKEKEAAADYAKAIGQFELLQRKHKGEKHVTPNVALGLCAAYTGLGKDDQAITICEQIVRKPGGDPKGSAWYNLAKAYAKKKQWARVRTAATEFNKLRKNEAKGYILIGDSYAGERKWDLALENYKQAERLLKPNESAKKADLSISMGVAYQNGSRPDIGLAIQKLEEGQNARPDDPRVAINLGSAYIKNKQDEKAVATTDRLIGGKRFNDLTPVQQVDLLTVAAKGLYNQGKLKDSRDRFQRAYNIRKDVQVQKALIQVIEFQAYQAFQKDDVKTAENLLDQASQIDPKDKSIALRRAVILIDGNECADAQKQLAKLEGDGAFTVQYQRLMARTFMCIGKPNKKKAAEFYAAAAKEVERVQDPVTEAEINIEWSPLLLDEGRAEEAVNRLENAVRTAMQEKRLEKAAKRNLAVALFRRGWKNLKEKPDQAAADFERAGREPALLKGVEPLAFEFSHALALLEKGDANEAARIFKSLSNKGNQNAYLKAPYNKVGTDFFAAYANYRAGTAEKRQAAATQFQSMVGSASGAFAQKIKDLLASSYEFVAYDAWRGGSEGQASKALTQAAKFATGDAEKRIRNNRAVLSMGGKQLDTFRDLGGTPPEALVNLGVLYDQAGKPKEAYEAWKSARARGANARDLNKWIDAKKRIYGFD
jgi:lipopolysaccharide biosynthesis regulator YciM